MAGDVGGATPPSAAKAELARVFVSPPDNVIIWGRRRSPRFCSQLNPPLIFLCCCLHSSINPSLPQTLREEEEKRGPEPELS